MLNKKPFAKKSFGQNFLVDQNYINRIIAALDPQINETIIEIGAGRGALTEKLVESGANIVAVEIERDMIHVLKGKFSDAENFQLIEADALKIDFTEISNFKSRIADSENRKPKIEEQKTKIKLVANLPYYISTAILQKLIEQREVFSEMVLMFQKEVVERITAKVGNSERGFLTVLTEAYLTANKLFDVPPSAFRPSPKVNSAIVRLRPKSRLVVQDSDLFRAVVSAAFVQKRKTIYNNLKSLQLKDIVEIDWLKILESAQIESARRAESLHLEEWDKLISAVTLQNGKTPE